MPTAAASKRVNGSHTQTRNTNSQHKLAKPSNGHQGKGAKSWVAQTGRRRFRCFASVAKSLAPRCPCNHVVMWSCGHVQKRVAGWWRVEEGRAAANGGAPVTKCRPVQGTKHSYTFKMRNNHSRRSTRKPPALAHTTTTTTIKQANSNQQQHRERESNRAERGQGNSAEIEVRSRTSVIASGHRLIQSRASEIGSGLISRNRLLSLCSLVGSVSLPPSTLYSSLPSSTLLLRRHRCHSFPASLPITTRLPLSSTNCVFSLVPLLLLLCGCHHKHSPGLYHILSLSLSLSHSHTLQSIERSFLSLSLSQPPPLPRLPRLLWILGCVLLSYPPPPSLPIVFPSAVVASSIDHSIVHCSRLRATVWFRVLVYCVVIVIVVFVVDLLSAYCIDYLLVLFDQFSRCLASSSSSSSTHSRLVDHGPTPWC
jgi:hypothetical protein